MDENKVYIRNNKCRVCGETVYYSLITERINCGCGKRKQKYTPEFENALKQLWKPSLVNGETIQK